LLIGASPGDKVITDFAASQDVIVFASQLLAGTLVPQDIYRAFATVTDAGTLFQFAETSVLLQDVTDEASVVASLRFGDTLLTAELPDPHATFATRPVLEGGEGSDYLRGLDFGPILRGKGGSDFLEGGKGVDLLDGETGDDVLLGREGNDGLIGGFGDDRLFGGPGDDRLQGFPGQDTLSGGPGADLFTFFFKNEVDIITDFDPAVDTLRPQDLAFFPFTSEGRVETGEELVEAFAVVTPIGTRLEMPQGTVVLVNVSDLDALADAIWL